MCTRARSGVLRPCRNFLTLIINELMREVILVERYKKWEGEDLKSEGQGKDANGGYAGNLLC
jgi:hypothetical protein